MWAMVRWSDYWYISFSPPSYPFVYLITFHLLWPLNLTYSRGSSGYESVSLLCQSEYVDMIISLIASFFFCPVVNATKEFFLVSLI